MSDASDDDAKWRATFDDDELVTLPPPRPSRAQVRRMELRLPDRLRRFVEHEAARLCEPASVIVRRALTSTPEWKAWDAQQSPTAAPPRRDGRLAPEGVETARGKAARLRRAKLASEAHLYRMHDGKLLALYGSRDELLGHQTWEGALEQFRRTLRVPGPPAPVCAHASVFDWVLKDILTRREEVYREAGLTPPEIPEHLAAYKAACPHGLIAGERCDECGGDVPYTA